MDDGVLRAGAAMDHREHIRKALALSGSLLVLADQEKLDGEEDGCLMLDGVLRDCAYKIRGAAEGWRGQAGARPTERSRHT
jgi:hypothetical protein